MWKIQLNTTVEAVEALAEALGQQLDSRPVIELRPGRATGSVAVYLSGRMGNWAQTRRRLRQAIEQVRDCGLDVGRVRIQRRWLRSQNWAQAWKRHFKPIEIGHTLLVRPGWSRRRPRPGQVEVVLDPGLSFGTGHHPTTAWCLRELVRLRKTGQVQSFLDMGTGSGILAIAAAKLGYRPVVALEVDGQAARIARTNARRNGVASKMRVVQADVQSVPARWARRFAVVCANLSAPLLVRARWRIAARVERGGALVLAGILQSEFASVLDAYRELGLELERTWARRRWQSGTFRRRPAAGAATEKPV